MLASGVVEINNKTTVHKPLVCSNVCLGLQAIQTIKLFMFVPIKIDNTPYYNINVNNLQTYTIYGEKVAKAVPFQSNE